MTKADIEKLLIEEISEILKLNGWYEAPLNSGIRPLEDLGGFDSLNAFEVASSISQKIGKKINVESFGIECGKPNPNLLTISEIADIIFKIAQK